MYKIWLKKCHWLQKFWQNSVKGHFWGHPADSVSACVAMLCVDMHYRLVLSCALLFIDIIFCVKLYQLYLEPHIRIALPLARPTGWSKKVSHLNKLY